MKIVLDLTDYLARTLALDLRQGRWGDIADQIEAQTKPARIPEPGLWGVVEARSVAPFIRQHFIRDTIYGGCGHWLLLYGTPETGARRYGWADLIDPTLIREGVTS